MLELEKRIYNNCKTAFNSELLSEDDVRPGVFRTTEYNNSEIDNILSLDFYAWAGQNGIEYQNNLNYDENDYFTFKLKECKVAGIKNTIIDPGFGFGKTLEHNYELLNKLEELKKHKVPVLVGVSRKGMIQKVLSCDAEHSLNGTSIVNTIALLNGASILRVHDVKEAMEAIKIVNQMKA